MSKPTDIGEEQKGRHSPGTQLVVGPQPPPPMAFWPQPPPLVAGPQPPPPMAGPQPPPPMVGLAWLKSYHQVAHFVKEHGYPPGKAENKCLAQWIACQRRHLRKKLVGKDGPEQIDGASVAAKYKANRLLEIGIDIQTYNPKAYLTRQQMGLPTWDEVILERLVMDGEDHDDNDMLVHQEYLEKLRPKFQRPDAYLSLAEFLICCYKVNDIDPRECTREQDVNTMRHILSYIANPEPAIGTVTFSKRLKMSGDSSLFSSQRFRSTDVLEKMSVVEQQLPEFIRDIFTGKRKFRRRDPALAKLIESERKWFDHFPIFNSGTTNRNGQQDSCEPTQPGPRQLHLFAEVNGPTYSELYKCHTEEGYGYSYSFLPKCFMGGRCWRDYPGVADMGITVWKNVLSYLTPLSQQTPPNSCTVLTYFDAFNSHIKPHQYNSPNMDLFPENNSQILGSSVIVVTMYDAQFVEFTQNADITKGPSLDAFYADHFSVYIINCWDDLAYFHRSIFWDDPGTGNRSRVRVAFTYRWLGRRHNYFCSDYNGRRQYCEVYRNAAKVVRDKFPNDEYANAMYNLKNKAMNYDKSLFHPTDPSPAKTVFTHPPKKRIKTKSTIVEETASLESTAII